jgi:hypothetical protein
MAQEKLPYKIGTIKLTWINPKNYKILESKMFNSVSEALANIPASKGNNWLVFELSETDGKKYKWKLLPYGKHKVYVNGMRLRDNPILRYGFIGLALFGGYCLLKNMSK